MPLPIFRSASPASPSTFCSSTNCSVSDSDFATVFMKEEGVWIAVKSSCPSWSIDAACCVGGAYGARAWADWSSYLHCYSMRHFLWTGLAGVWRLNACPQRLVAETPHRWSQGQSCRDLPSTYRQSPDLPMVASKWAFSYSASSS